ncbi:MAG: hypothetical protein LAO79_11765 [Acidobacteriia bacterium]|nr:hypothetical protein [Terriglobia bacterium]
MTETKEQTTIAGNAPGQWFYATRPTRWTLFLRTFLPWQAWRFLWINAKMIRIIGRGHRDL